MSWLHVDPTILSKLLIERHARTLLFVLIVAGFFLSWLLTCWMRRYALHTHLVDNPNERSSHSAPTPRGGGVAFVLLFLLLTLAMGVFGWVEQRLMIASLGAGAMVAVLGFVDDRSGLPARWRFLGHLAAAIWVLAWMGPVPPVPLFGVVVHLSYAGPLLCALYIVWMINLFNFMDGIDGIASVEAITTSLGGALLWWLAGSGNGWVVPWCLPATTSARRPGWW